MQSKVTKGLLEQYWKFINSMRVIGFLIVMVLVAGSAYAEPSKGDPYHISPENADCPNAIEVTEPVFGPTNAPEGHGEILEFEGNQLGNPYFIQREHHTVWYYFEIPASGQLTFEIIPEAIEDDYDFMLFEHTGEDFCERVKEQEIKPVRTNISRNNKDVDSRTGLAEGAQRKYVPAGPNPDFSKPLPVKRGQVFYLLVDNVYDGGEGHTLKIDFPQPDASLTANIVDQSTGEPIAGEITYRKPDDEEPSRKFEYKPGEKLEIPVQEVDATYLITAREDGYFFETEPVRTEPGNNHVEIELKPIDVGETLSLHNIHFEPNETIIMPHSEPEMDELLEFLRSHETLEAEIQGHVNGPHRPNSEFYQELSDNRALKIREFLIEEGVDEDRIDWQGYGNTRMKYPNPRSEYQQRMNRRVDVEITGIREK